LFDWASGRSQGYFKRKTAEKNEFERDTEREGERVFGYQVFEDLTAGKRVSSFFFMSVVFKSLYFLLRRCEG